MRPLTAPRVMVRSRTNDGSAAIEAVGARIASQKTRADAARNTPTKGKSGMSAIRSHVNRIEAGPEPLGQFHRVVVGPEVDEECAGLVVEHVIVDRRDLDAVVPQGFDQRIDLAGK